MTSAKATSKSMSTEAFYSQAEEDTPEAPLPRFSGFIMPVEPNVVPAAKGKGRGRGKKTNTEVAVDAVTANEVQLKEKTTKKAPAGRRGAKKEPGLELVAEPTDAAQPEPAENGKRTNGRARGKKAVEVNAEVVKKAAKEPSKGRGKKELKPAAVAEESANGEQESNGGGEHVEQPKTSSGRKGKYKNESNGGGDDVEQPKTSSGRKGRNANKDDPVPIVKDEPEDTIAEVTKKTVEPTKGRGKKASKPAAVVQEHTNGDHHAVDGEQIQQPPSSSGRKGRKAIKEEPLPVVKEEPVPEVEVEQMPTTSTSTKKVEKPKRGKRAAPAEEPVKEEINAIVEAAQESPKKKSKRDKKEAKKEEENDAKPVVSEQPQEEVVAKPSREQQKAAKSATKAAEKAAKRAKQGEEPVIEKAESTEPDEEPVAKAAKEEEEKASKKAAKEEEKIAKAAEKAAHKAAKEEEKAAKEAAKKLAKDEKKKGVKAKSVDPEAEEVSLPTGDAVVAGRKAAGRGGRKRAAVVDEELATEEDADNAQPPKNKKGLMNSAETVYNQSDFCLSPEMADLFNFKISSWNVAGLRAWLKKDGLKFLEFEQPDIFCLQEIKCTEEQLPEEAARISGYHPYWATMPGGANGVAIYSKIMPINVEYGIGSEDFDQTGRIITAEYEKFYLINTYVPNSGRKLVNLESRMQWEELFLAYIRKLDAKKPVVICGDMNVSHQEIDLANPKTNTRNAGFTKEERDKMTELLAAGFVDTFRELYPDRKGAYTFWTYMGNARARNVGWRLDYFIVSERFRARVIENCIRSQCKGSDHCPITIFLKL